MKMLDAEKEALRLCPGSSVSLSYERSHIIYGSYQSSHRGTSIKCTIWVSKLRELFTGYDWDTAIMELRNFLRVNPPQPCPDDEVQELTA